MTLWWHSVPVCSGLLGTARDSKRLYKLLRRARPVLDCPLDSMEVVGERRMLAKQTAIVDRTSHPLPQTVEVLSSSVSSRSTV